jgi:putative transposase
MARPLRLQLAGGIYHVTARGNRRQRIFRSEADFLLYLDILDRVAERFEWEVYAYCLMPNHVHLVFRTKHANIAQGMQRLHGLYAQFFNERHGLTGHLFQGRYHSELVKTERHALAVARYVVANPVRAGLCIHPAEWPWSSYRATAGLVRPPRFLDTAWLLGHLSPDPSRARAAYVEYVAERAPPRRATVTRSPRPYL